MDLITLQMIWAVLSIIMIDIVLAGDNALVIGMAANKLPQHLRQRAILWGTIGAVGIRFISVAALTYLLMIPGLRLIGGLALLWIGWKLAFNNEEHEIKTQDTFWSAIGTIVVADAVMGIDNALGIAAAAGGNFLLIIFGLLISVPIILFGAGIVSKTLNRWPNLIFVGSGVLFVVAFQMITKEPLLNLNNSLISIFTWIAAIVLTLIQYYCKMKKTREW